MIQQAPYYLQALACSSTYVEIFGIICTVFYMLYSVHTMFHVMHVLMWDFRPFSLEDLTDYQVHFTVMNYQSEFELKQIHYNDFIPLFEKQYPDHPWEKIEVHTQVYA